MSSLGVLVLANGKVHDSTTWLDFEIQFSRVVTVGGLQRKYSGGGGPSSVGGNVYPGGFVMNKTWSFVELKRIA